MCALVSSPKTLKKVLGVGVGQLYGKGMWYVGDFAICS